jgi:hypothetical protein
MFFRIWYYLCVVGPPVLFPMIFLGFLFRESSPRLAVTGWVALSVFVGLGITGAILAVLLLFCGLRLRCPFCGEPGDFCGSKEAGVCLLCDRCGLVQGSGFLKLRLVRQWEMGHPSRQRTKSSQYQSAAR